MKKICYGKLKKGKNRCTFLDCLHGIPHNENAETQSGELCTTKERCPDMEYDVKCVNVKKKGA